MRFERQITPGPITVTPSPAGGYDATCTATAVLVLENGRRFEASYTAQVHVDTAEHAGGVAIARAEQGALYAAIGAANADMAVDDEFATMRGLAFLYEALERDECSDLRTYAYAVPALRGMAEAAYETYRTGDF